MQQLLPDTRPKIHPVVQEAATLNRGGEVGPECSWGKPTLFSAHTHTPGQVMAGTVKYCRALVLKPIVKRWNIPLGPDKIQAEQCSSLWHCSLLEVGISGGLLDFLNVAAVRWACKYSPAGLCPAVTNSPVRLKQLLIPTFCLPNPRRAWWRGSAREYDGAQGFWGGIWTWVTQMSNAYLISCRTCLGIHNPALL